MSKYLSFETDRLILIPTSEEDASLIHELMNTPKWLKYIGDRHINSIGDAKQYIKEKMLSQLKKRGFSNYTVIRKSDGMKLGLCGLYDREGTEGVDIGFAFLPHFEKMGYAFESANKIKEAGFQEFKLKQINAFTIEDNLDSQQLLKKLGMKFQKMTRLPNDKKEVMVFSIYEEK